MAGVRTQIIRIGNSQGIRLPKAILEQCHFEKEVILEPGEEGLVVRPAKQVRTGWEEAFRQMGKRKDDVLLDSDAASETDWEEDEWEW
jgi:antitoxin MazE